MDRYNLPVANDFPSIPGNYNVVQFSSTNGRNVYLRFGDIPSSPFVITIAHFANELGCRLDSSGSADSPLLLPASCGYTLTGEGVCTIDPRHRIAYFHDSENGDLSLSRSHLALLSSALPDWTIESSPPPRFLLDSTYQAIHA